MSVGPFVLSVLITLGLTLYQVNRYSDVRKSYSVTATVIVAWFLSFIIVVALPLDVSSVGLFHFMSFFNEFLCF